MLESIFGPTTCTAGQAAASAIGEYSGGKGFGNREYGADYGTGHSYGRSGQSDQYGGGQFGGQQYAGQGSNCDQGSYGGGSYGGGQNASRGRHQDPDYQQWRDEQLRDLDDDYESWRGERYKKFSDDFSSWRSNRSQGSSGSAQGGRDSTNTSNASTGSSDTSSTSATGGSGIVGFFRLWSGFKVEALSLRLGGAPGGHIVGCPVNLLVIAADAALAFGTVRRPDRSGRQATGCVLEDGLSKLLSLLAHSSGRAQRMRASSVHGLPHRVAVTTSTCGSAVALYYARLGQACRSDQRFCPRRFSFRRALPR